MTTTLGRIPPGPIEPYTTSQDLVNWMREQFERFGDIFKASINGATTYVIRDPGYAQHVLRDNWQNYVKGQEAKRIALLLGNGLVNSEGELWKRQRRMTQPALHRESMAAQFKVMTAANSSLLEAWQEAARNNQQVNVTVDISRLVLRVTLAAIFGEDYSHVEQPFRILSEEPTRGLAFAQTFRSLGKLVLEVVNRRRSEHRVLPDILGILMEARDPGRNSAMLDRQLLNEIMTLIVAGHETTASTLNWLWYLLSQHRKVMEKLVDELDTLSSVECRTLDDLNKFTYTRQVIEETLRLYPALWLIPRRALKDDWLDDYFVPAGTEIYIQPYFMQRHPALWSAPDCFDPERFGPGRSSEHHRLAMLPFSAGPRNCIGEHFARVEMQVHLVMIASRLWLRYDAATPPELDVGVNLRSKHAFMMTPEIRSGRSRLHAGACGPEPVRPCHCSSR